MKVQDFVQIASSESRALQYLLKTCFSRGDYSCPRCSSVKYYRIENGRRCRCASCTYTFNALAGRWFNNVKIGARQWLWIIKLFELECTAAAIQSEAGISYPTVLKAINTIRKSMASSSVEAGASCFFRVLPDETVYGVVDNDKGATSLEPVQNDLVMIKMAIGHDVLILANRQVGYHSLRWSGRIANITDRGDTYLKYKTYCSRRGFWSFPKERLQKYHGVPRKYLPLYLKEIEFRWCHRNEQLFDVIISVLGRRIPAATGTGDC